MEEVNGSIEYNGQKHEFRHMYRDEENNLIFVLHDGNVINFGNAYPVKLSYGLDQNPSDKIVIRNDYKWEI